MALTIIPVRYRAHKAKLFALQSIYDIEYICLSTKPLGMETSYDNYRYTAIKKYRELY